MILIRKAAGLLAALLAASAAAQEEPPAAPSATGVTGYYTGAIIQRGAPFLVETRIYESEDGLFAKTAFPEWLWYDLPPDPVTLTQEGIVIADIFRGDADFAFDSQFRQLVGEGEGYSVHLKPALPPAGPPVLRREIGFESKDGTRIEGTLVLPPSGGPHAAVVIVRGRGCSQRVEPQAALFARYGIAAFTYDRRGSGRSEGDCAAHTFEALVDDVSAAMEALAEEPAIHPGRIGLRGSSLGAWVAQGVVARHLQGALVVKPAFLITWIGPATSILDQQIQSALAIAEQEDLPPGAGKAAAEAARIAADPAIPQGEAFARLSEIRATAEAEGWLDAMFAPDDLPLEPADVDGLFLRRFRFDPAPVLAGLDGTPVLAIFGEEDAIVPLAPNLAALSAIEKAGGDLSVVTIPGLGHGTEHGDREVTLPGGGSYFKADTVEPVFMISTIGFLRAKGFAPDWQ